MAALRACRGCGYRLVADTEPRCPECGRRFDPEDPQTFRVALSRPELLARYELEWVGEALRAELFGHGVLSSIETSLGGVAGYAPRREVRVFVDAADLARAQSLLGAGERRAEGAWSCSRCDEAVPGSFELCWACGEPRGAAANGPPSPEQGAPSASGGAGATDPTARRGRRAVAVAVLAGGPIVATAFVVGAVAAPRGAIPTPWRPSTGTLATALLIVALTSLAGSVLLAKARRNA